MRMIKISADYWGSGIPEGKFADGDESRAAKAGMSIMMNVTGVGIFVEYALELCIEAVLNI